MFNYFQWRFDEPFPVKEEESFREMIVSDGDSMQKVSQKAKSNIFENILTILICYHLAIGNVKTRNISPR